MFTVMLVVVLVFLLIALGIFGDRTAHHKTLEIVEVDEDDTKQLRKLIRPR